MNAIIQKVELAIVYLANLYFSSCARRSPGDVRGDLDFKNEVNRLAREVLPCSAMMLFQSVTAHLDLSAFISWPECGVTMSSQSPCACILSSSPNRTFELYVHELFRQQAATFANQAIIWRLKNPPRPPIGLSGPRAEPAQAPEPVAQNRAAEDGTSDPFATPELREARVAGVGTVPELAARWEMAATDIYRWIRNRGEGGKHPWVKTPGKKSEKAERIEEQRG